MNRGIAIHGMLLVVMLGYGYRAWTEDSKDEKENRGSVEVWNKSGLTLISYDKHVVVGKRDTTTNLQLEKRKDSWGTYWWGIETRTTKTERPAPKATPAVEGQPPTPRETTTDTKTTTEEFPLGAKSLELEKQWNKLRALASLGKLATTNKADYGLDDSESLITFTFGAEQSKLIVGDNVYGSSDRYVTEVNGDTSFTLAGSLLGTVTGGKAGLSLRRFIDIEEKDLAEVTLSTGGKSVTIVSAEEEIKSESTSKSKTKKFGWAKKESPKSIDDGLTTFFKKIQSVAPKEYKPSQTTSELKEVVVVKFISQKGAEQQLTIYSKSEPPEPPQTAAKVNYFARSTLSRVPATIPQSIGEFVQQNISQLTGE